MSLLDKKGVEDSRISTEIRKQLPNSQRLLTIEVDQNTAVEGMKISIAEFSKGHE